MTYWMDLFSKTTWEEFRVAGSNVSGFNELKAKYWEIVKPGDVFLCYMTGGVFLWVGALEVLGPSQDKRRIWKEAAYPVRFDVKPIVELDAETGLPMKELEGKVEFYRGSEDKGKYQCRIRTSLGKPISNVDGSLILSLLKSQPKAQ